MKKREYKKEMQLLCSRLSKEDLKLLETHLFIVLNYITDSTKIFALSDISENECDKEYSQLYTEFQSRRKAIFINSCWNIDEMCEKCEIEPIFEGIMGTVEEKINIGKSIVDDFWSINDNQ